MDKNLLEKSAIELKKLIIKKEISPVELTKLSLERIQETNSKTNTFITIMEDKALDDAKKEKKKILKGEKLGLMAGIPTSIKDLEPVKDVRITKGSLALKNVIADHDQICVERIKKEDGIILGKTNCSEFGHSGTGENKLGDETRNPWNLDYTSGASSGGSAVSVATSVNTVAQASDGGGSVRIPASLNGIVGLKTTKNKWPTDGIFPLSPTLDTPGPIGRSVKDIKLIFNTYNNSNPLIAPLKIEGMRLGKLQEPFTSNLDLQVAEAYDNFCIKLKDLGATIENVTISEANEKAVLFPKIVGSEIISAFGKERFLDNVDKMDSVTGHRAKLGLNVSSIEYINKKKN